jgi:hypothetical protein
MTVGLVPLAAAGEGRTVQPKPVIGIVWDGQSGAFQYTAGREGFADLQAARTDPTQHEVAFRIARDSTVVFSVDGRERWRSSLRYGSDVGRMRVQLWLGGHATGASVAVTSVSLGAGEPRP